jgi:hypothetical protein
MEGTSWRVIGQLVRFLKPKENPVKTVLELIQETTAALTLEAFQTWLERNANNGVGVAGSSISCPIANYLIESGIADGARVAHDSIRVRKFGPKNEYVEAHLDAPAWARRFVGKLDAQDAGDKRRFTGSECKAILGGAA